MPHSINYADFARALAALPMDATCADLSHAIRAYTACEPTLHEQLIAAVGELPGEAEWMQGLFRVCRVLKEEQPRFQEALFMDDLVMYDR